MLGTDSHLDRVVMVAPGIYPLGREGYGGIERLVVLFLRGLAKSVTSLACVCPQGSLLPRGVQRVDAGPACQDYSEPGLNAAVKVTYMVSRLLRESRDWCYLDFSHSKPVSRLGRSLFPNHMSPIWHDPYIMTPWEPEKNVVALSKWQAKRYRERYGRDCMVLDPICGDGDYFVPGEVPREVPGEVPGESKGDYLIFIGKLHPTKGALQAIEVCKSLKQRLHIIGPVTAGDSKDYVERVIKECDGEDIVYEGEVSEGKKRALIQGARALLYPVSYPYGEGEAHSHKMVEAMLAGVPCIAYDQGAMSEVIDEGVTGFVIPGPAGLAAAIKQCEVLDRVRCRAVGMERWDYRRVVAKWLPVMESVMKGECW